MKTDRQLRQEVIDELGCDGHFGGMDLHVAVDDGVVTLSGSVETASQRTAAEAAARGIEGVKRVVALLAVNEENVESQSPPVARP